MKRTESGVGRNLGADLGVRPLGQKPQFRLWKDWRKDGAVGLAAPVGMPLQAKPRLG